MDRAGIRRWVAVVAYMAAIFWESSLERAPLPPGVSDKLGHAAGYALLAVLVVRALAGGLPARLGAGLVSAALAITVGYGATDEWHQLFVAGREGDWLDLRADAIGAVVAVAACWAWGIIAPRSGPHGVADHEH